jgi:hypothetical protein
MWTRLLSLLKSVQIFLGDQYNFKNKNESQGLIFKQYIWMTLPSFIIAASKYFKVHHLGWRVLENGLLALPCKAGILCWESL